MKNKGIVAVVPTRKGSQRVLSKNTRPFADTSLLELKINVLKKVRGIDKIVVNTDCERSVSIAKKYGVNAHVRDPYFASSEVTNDIHWKHIADTTDGEIILMAQTTSPMVKVSTYEKAINLYLSSDYDSVNSVNLEKKFLWHQGKPLNYDIKRTPKSQELPDIVSLNFAITVISKIIMYERENVVGVNPKFLILDKVQSVDVDDQIDFEFAEYTYSKYGFSWLLQ